MGWSYARPLNAWALECAPEGKPKYTLVAYWTMSNYHWSSGQLISIWFKWWTKVTTRALTPWMCSSDWLGFSWTKNSLQRTSVLAALWMLPLEENSKICKVKWDLPNNWHWVGKCDKYCFKIESEKKWQKSGENYLFLRDFGVSFSLENALIMKCCYVCHKYVPIFTTSALAALFLVVPQRKHIFPQYSSIPGKVCKMLKKQQNGCLKFPLANRHCWSWAK